MSRSSAIQGTKRQEQRASHPFFRELGRKTEKRGRSASRVRVNRFDVVPAGRRRIALEPAAEFAPDDMLDHIVKLVEEKAAKIEAGEVEAFDPHKVAAE